ncbi:MAG: hypothetical protein K0U98_19965 [Deltaproteobacteria bacterium]|nr:hypothetical protein [Deltaproteobacteria bacterium]
MRLNEWTVLVLCLALAVGFTAVAAEETAVEAPEVAVEQSSDAACQTSSDQQDAPAIVTFEDETAIPVELGKGSGSSQCGGNVCGPFFYCCNASCGICAPYGGSCTQQNC